MCSVRKKHFLFILLCLCSGSGLGGGVSILGTRFRDLPRRQRHVPGDWNSQGCPCFVLWPVAARRGGRLGASVAPGPGAPLRGPKRAPSLTVHVFISRPLSLSSRDPWAPLLRASSCIQTQSFVGALSTPDPRLGLGGALPPLPPLGPGPAPSPTPWPPLSRPPGGPRAALPDLPPSKLGLDSASPRAPFCLPSLAA